MDPKTVRKLETALEKPIVDVIGRLGPEPAAPALSWHCADDGQGSGGRLRSGGG